MQRETRIQTETGKRMLRAVTPIYTDEYQLSIFNANGLIMEELQGITNKIGLEVLINNATWSLPYWESLFRIKPTDNQTIEQRRHAVILRMNEYFPVTRRRMESIVDTFTENGGTVINDKRGDYSFEIILRNSGAIDFINMVAAVEETKPAHLAALFAALAEEVTAIITPKEYTFPVPHPITDTFYTAPVHGVGSMAKGTVTSKSYNFAVPYPITNTDTFHTVSLKGIGSSAIANVQTEAYSFPIFYPVCGTFFCTADVAAQWDIDGGSFLGEINADTIDGGLFTETYTENAIDGGVF